MKETKFNHWLIVIVLAVVALGVIYFTNTNTANLTIGGIQGGGNPAFPHSIPDEGDTSKCNPDPIDPTKCIECQREYGGIICQDSEGNSIGYHCGWKFWDYDAESRSGNVCKVVEACQAAKGNAVTSATNACGTIAECPTFSLNGTSYWASCTVSKDPILATAFCEAKVVGKCVGP